MKKLITFLFWRMQKEGYCGKLQKFEEYGIKVLCWTNMKTGVIEISIIK